MFFKIGVLNNFINFTKKPVLSLFYFDKFAFLKRPATLLKKDCNIGVFL